MFLPLRLRDLSVSGDEFKVNITVSDADRLFFTDKVRNSVFWR
jgi:hypothetical protein